MVFKQRVSNADIMLALKDNNGNKSMAAKDLGISRQALYARLVRFGWHSPVDKGLQAIMDSVRGII